MECGGLWLCGYLPISRVLREQGQLLPNPQTPQVFCLSMDCSPTSPGQIPNPFVGSGGPPSSRCPGQPQPCTQLLSALSHSGTLPSQPKPSPPHAFTGGGVGLTPCAGSASSPHCLFTRPWNHSSLGTSHPPVWLAHVASVCQGALVMQPQEKLPRGCDFLRRNLDDKFLKEKWNFIYGRHYCVRVRVLLHNPT